MPKTKFNSKQNPKGTNRAFQLKGEVEFYHKYFYINYINKLAPEIAKELNMLTTQCVELFGKFPDFTHNSSFETQSNLFHEIWLVFTRCVWKETRDYMSSFEWRRILSEKDESLISALKIQEKFNESINTVVKNLLKEKFEDLKFHFSSTLSLEPDEITEFAIDLLLKRLLHERIKENEESYHQTEKTILEKLQKLTAFQNAFDSLLTKFCLEKEWLAEIVFRAIWDGTGKLQMFRYFSEEFNSELIADIKANLGQKNELKSGNEVISALEEGIPLHAPFVYNEPWFFERFEVYEEAAVKAYRKFIHEYLKVIKELFEKYDYKPKRKNYDYKRVKWLVWWNIKQWDKSLILEEIDKEFQEKEIEKYYSLSTVDKAFHRFKKYDLPIRV
jgi:hypothetical protein